MINACVSGSADRILDVTRALGFDYSWHVRISLYAAKHRRKSIWIWSICWLRLPKWSMFLFCACDICVFNNWLINPARAYSTKLDHLFSSCRAVRFGSRGVVNILSSWQSSIRTIIAAKPADADPATAEPPNSRRLLVASKSSQSTASASLTPNPTLTASSTGPVTLSQQSLSAGPSTSSGFTSLFKQTKDNLSSIFDSVGVLASKIPVSRITVTVNNLFVVDFRLRLLYRSGGWYCIAGQLW